MHLMSTTGADAVVPVDRWLAKLEGAVFGPGLASDGKCPVWHHLLVSPTTLLAILCTSETEFGDAPHMLSLQFYMCILPVS